MYECEKYYELLELNSVLSKLSDEASLETTKEAALLLRPFDSFSAIEAELNKTDEAFVLSAKYASPSFGRAKNPGGLLTRCEVGAVLTMGELLSILESLRIIRTVKDWRDNISDNSVCYLNELFGFLYPNKYLEERRRCKEVLQ